MYAKAKNYLVSISIIEGRHFAWPNMDSAVLVRVDNQKRCTKVVRSTDCPFFSEYFVFEFHIKPEELLDKNITLTVIKPRTCCSKKKILGYVTLDVATVWDHDDHQFYHKWAIIMAPTSDSVAGARGYLKVDICVLSKGESPKIPDMVDDNDEIEGNLLLPEGITTERVRTNYIFSVYKGENLMKLKSSKGSVDKSAPNACLEISFVGLKGRTSVQKDEAFPEWNQKVTLTELFPPLCQRIKLEIKNVDCLHSTVCAVHYINLRNISNAGERGFLPTFGPTYIQFYNRGAYVGQILFSMKTELHDFIALSKDAVLEPIPPLNEPSLLRKENVLLFATIFEVTAIHKMFTNKLISFEISCGANADSEDDGLNRLLDMETNTHDDCTWYLEIEHEKPCLHINSSWLDFRRRMYNNNMLEKICIETRKQLDEIESMFDNEINPPSKEEISVSIVNMLDNLSSSCRKYIDISSSAVGIGNDLDRERLRLCLEEIGQIEETSRRLYNSRTRKRSFQKAQRLYEKLIQLAEEPQDCWPDVIIKMFYGGKPIAFYQFPARQIAFSLVEEESGINCGKLQDIFIKMATRKGIFSDQNTICRLNVRFWLGLERHKEHCFNTLPPSFRSSTDPRGVSPPEHLITEEEQVFQCRAHIYQSRISPGADSSGLCDAFAKVLIGEHCKTTEIKKATLNPIWDETLTFNNIVLYGSVDFIKRHPPPVILIVLDQDICHKTDCIGRVVVQPVIKFSNQSYTSPTYPPKLQWHKLYNDDESLGDILAVVELLQKTGLNDDDEDDDKSTTEIVRIPSDIKPTLEQHRIEVVFWGLRDMKKIHMLPITKPKIKLVISGEILQSKSIPDARKSLNFPEPLKHIDVELPTNAEYAPPLCLKMFDRRSFGRNTYAGTNIVSVQSCLFHSLLAEEREQLLAGIGVNSFDSLNSSLNESSIRFLTIEQLKRKSKSMETVPVVEDKKPPKKRNWRSKFLTLIRRNSVEEEDDEDSNNMPVTDEADDETFDWWTRYYASVEPERQNSANPINKVPRLKIYNSELEKQPEFNNFSDLLRSFPMYKGKRTGDETVDEENITGVLKGSIKIYRSPLTTALNYVTPSGLSTRDGVFQDFPPNEHVRYTARVYCVKGINVRPKDINGKSDPYVYIKMNGQVINDSENYVPNQVNPIFGRCFEIEGVLPMDHTIKIALWDKDLTTADDLIGETTIDLENRVFTNHRAICGLPLEYHESGYRAWRDYNQPTNILSGLCKKFNLPPPEYAETSVKVGCKVFMPTQSVVGCNPNQLREICALAALRRWKEIPVIGCDLLPEHVETRSLYHPSKPGIEQGKLQLWIDIFPASDLPIPKSVDITPKQPVSYELRVTIWNTEDVKLDEKDLLSGERVSDIYVKGWITGPDQAQCTDVHYRSLTGEGNFNWRLVFRFDYLISENKLVVKTKAGLFDLDETEIKMPCRLTLQVWDNDTFSRDDFLGVVTFELSHMPKGARHSKYCTLKILNKNAPSINLFKIKRTKGWWPFRNNEEEEGETLAGKVEAELELLTVEEADKEPVGAGRNEPHALPQPNRPDTSFSWFRNPLKALKYTICKLHRKKIAMTCLCLGLIMMAALAIYAFPGYTVKKILHA